MSTHPLTPDLTARVVYSSIPKVALTSLPLSESGATGEGSARAQHRAHFGGAGGEAPASKGGWAGTPRKETNRAAAQPRPHGSGSVEEARQ